MRVPGTSFDIDISGEHIFHERPDFLEVRASFRFAHNAFVPREAMADRLFAESIHRDCIDSIRRTLEQEIEHIRAWLMMPALSEEHCRKCALDRRREQLDNGWRPRLFFGE